MARYSIVSQPRRSLILLLPCLLAALLLPVRAAPAEREARFLTFNAVDKNGVYVRKLKLDEVSLYLDDQPVKVSYLGKENVDTAYVFLLENSPRTAPSPVSNPRLGVVNPIDKIRYQLEGGFFHQLTRKGSVLLGEFYHEVTILQDFTTDEFRLEDALVRMEPNFAKVDTEHIPIGRSLARGVDLLKSTGAKRKVLVLFTTTVDHDSYQNLEEYRQMFQLSDVELYIISFAPRFVSGPGFTFEEKMNRYFFVHLTDETSGKLYLSGEYAYVPEFMDDLKTRMLLGWTIGFYVQPQDEPRPHAVRLKVRDDKIKVTCRESITY